MKNYKLISFSTSLCLSLGSSVVAQTSDEMSPNFVPDADVLNLFGQINDGEASILGQAPPVQQRDYLSRLQSAGNDMGVSIQSSDGSVAGEEVLRTMNGENDGVVATFSIQLAPHLWGQTANDVFAEEGLLIFNAAENSGVVSAGRIIGNESALNFDTDYNNALRNSLEELRDNPNFLSVAPERAYVNNQSGSPAFYVGASPSSLEPFRPKHVETGSVPKNQIHWGADNIKASKFWKHEALFNGSIVGVLDSGFSLHADLPYWDLDPSLPADDHGNHVAGILCGKHNDTGMSGVLPNCLVVARAPNFFEMPGLNGASPDSMAAVLNAFEKIIETRPEVKVVNISMGYNWKDKDVQRVDAETRDDIATMAGQMARVFRLAHENDIFIVSSAGNDSGGLDPKMSALWSSPLNLAIRGYCLKNGWCNGVIAEAHNSKDEPTDFSNGDGDLSCPGVRIVSTVAYDKDDLPSATSYAEMSGTSMAAPYCAGGLVLLSRLLGDPPAADVIECAKNNARRTGNFSAPALDIEAAFNSCK